MRHPSGSSFSLGDATHSHSIPSQPTSTEPDHTHVVTFPIQAISHRHTITPSFPAFAFTPEESGGPLPKTVGGRFIIKLREP